MKTNRELLDMLLEAINYSFFNPTTLDYNKELTCPVIDKVKYILRTLKENDEKEEFIKSELECIRGYREKAIERLTQLEKESEPSTHEMKVSTETEWHDVYTFCHEKLKLDDGEVAKITITKE